MVEESGDSTLGPGKPSTVAQKMFVKKSTMLVVYADPRGLLVLGRKVHPWYFWSFLDNG